MKNFIETYRSFEKLKQIDSNYRLFYLTYIDKWQVMCFKKTEILRLKPELVFVK